MSRYPSAAASFPYPLARRLISQHDASPKDRKASSDQEAITQKLGKKHSGGRAEAKGKWVYYAGRDLSVSQLRYHRVMGKFDSGIVNNSVRLANIIVAVIESLRGLNMPSILFGCLRSSRMLGACGGLLLG
jgi:hypothetical protein